MEVLQTSALPLGYGAEFLGGERVGRGLVSHGTGCSEARPNRSAFARTGELRRTTFAGWVEAKDGAGNGIRTRDFDLGKVALYH